MQLFVTLLDCSLPGFSVHGNFQAKILEWISIFLLQGIFLTQGSNLCLLYLLHCRWILYPLSWAIREGLSSLWKSQTRKFLYKFFEGGSQFISDLFLPWRYNPLRSQLYGKSCSLDFLPGTILMRLWKPKSQIELIWQIVSWWKPNLVFSFLLWVFAFT